MQSNSRLRTVLEGSGIWLLRLLMWPVPLRWAWLSGEVLGLLLFDVLRLARKETLDNLETAFGDRYTVPERVRLARRCYIHFGGVITEFLAMPGLTHERVPRFITLENPEVLERELEGGKGVLLAIGHLGHWEMLGAGISARGLPLSAYVGAQHNPIADRFINSVREGYGMRTLGKDAPLRGMLRALKENHVLALLTDQHYHRLRHFVRFFGQPVSRPSGVATLHRHSGVAVVFADVYRVRRSHYHARFQRLDDTPRSGDSELDVLRFNQSFCDALQAAVERHPEQYFWMHRVWRNPPHPEQLSAVNRRFLEETAALPKPHPPEADTQAAAAAALTQRTP